MPNYYLSSWFSSVNLPFSWQTLKYSLNISSYVSYFRSYKVISILKCFTLEASVCICPKFWCGLATGCCDAWLAPWSDPRVPTFEDIPNGMVLAEILAAVSRLNLILVRGWVIIRRLRDLCRLRIYGPGRNFVYNSWFTIYWKEFSELLAANALFEFMMWVLIILISHFSTDTTPHFSCILSYFSFLIRILQESLVFASILTPVVCYLVMKHILKFFNDFIRGCLYLKFFSIDLHFNLSNIIRNGLGEFRSCLFLDLRFVL